MNEAEHKAYCEAITLGNQVYAYEARALINGALDSHEWLWEDEWIVWC